MINNKITGWILCFIDVNGLIPFKKVINGIVTVSKCMPVEKRVLDFHAPIWAEPLKAGLPVTISIVELTCIVNESDKTTLLRRLKGCKILNVTSELQSLIIDNIKKIK